MIVFCACIGASGEYKIGECVSPKKSYKLIVTYSNTFDQDSVIHMYYKKKYVVIKDIIIMAKDKKIKELEEENKKLKEQLEILRGKLYEKL